MIVLKSSIALKQQISKMILENVHLCFIRVECVVK